ncbi:glutamate ABC transporter substrate-binding protein [Actinoplanes sp. CA-142083]|uniref:glutamate ABC transporter substrate-binding protein n=1 Tax=Actinoplanes sp. CA-142083 TaxID=3239903 RepID=UPI003D92CBC8
MRARLAAAAALMLVLAGCAGTGEAPGAVVASGAVPLPLNVQDPAAVPSAAPTPKCDPRASLPPSAQVGPTVAWIKKRGRLIVGIDQNAYLFGFRDPNTGELAGFEIDMARAVARAIFGDPEAVQFRAITTADRVPVLQRHEVDLVIRTMTMTCERWQQVSFSTEYLHSVQKLLVRKGEKIRSFAQLGGRKVCATRGSTSIRTIAAQPSKPVPVSTDSTLDCLVMLQQRQVDAVSTIDVLLAGLAAQDPGTEVVGPAVSNEPAGIGIAREQPDLVRFVNSALERIRADGTWQRSYDRWLAPRLGPAGPPAAVYRD